MPRSSIRPISEHPRIEHDYYSESPWAAEAIFRVERFPGVVCDPALGVATILKAAKAERGIPFFGSDIVDRVGPPWLAFAADFLNADDWGAAALHFSGSRDVDCIVSNPPFSLAERFVARALDVARFKVAMLLPLAFLEGDKRSRWLETTPLARVWVSRSRVGLRPRGEALKTDGGTKAFAWMIWEHGWRGPAQLGWFDKPKERA